MRDNKIVILHVFVDGIIFSKVADCYDTLDGVENLYYLYSPTASYVPQFINDPRVQFIYGFNTYVSLFSNPQIDVILFYALPYQFYYLFDYIDDSKFVIWWAWGYDLYYTQGKYPPLITMGEMYKPLTKKYIEKHDNSTKSIIHRRFIRALKLPFKVVEKLIHRNKPLYLPRKSQTEILSRIDSFYSPLDIEYDLLKQTHQCFKALRNPKVVQQHIIPFSSKNQLGNILVNHSLTYTDNHLDVFDILKSIPIEDKRHYIIPISYGINGFGGKPDNLIKESPLKEDLVIWLKEVIPLNEYEALLNTVSHAIFGALRQQALGNIYWCLKNGVKVFLYKDSILYRELHSKGYILFTIDNDLSLDSLSTCLYEREAMINHDIYCKWMSSNSPDDYQLFLEKVVLEKQAKYN